MLSKVQSCTALVVATLATFVVGQTEFTYEDQDAWSLISPTCSEGTRQSPIDIATASTTYDATLGDLEYKHPGLIFGDVINNGDTLMYTLNEASAIETYMQGLQADPDTTFGLKQLHFHWGNTKDKGSEHLIDGAAYSLEVHMVHLNTRYASIDEALGFADGLAVISLLFEETADEFGSSSALTTIAEYARSGNSAEYKNGITEEEIPLDLDDLLHQSQFLESKRFYAYEGSLTTPRCNEAVLWLVTEIPGKVSTSIMNNIRMAQATEESETTSHGIAPNYRRLQPLNNRIVRSSFTTGEQY